MAYSSEIYDKAAAKLEERRLRAEHDAETRKNEIYDILPEYRMVEQKLSECAVSLSLSMLQSGGDIADIQKRCEEAQLEKEKLLEAKGYGKDYLYPKYSCSKCSDTGWAHGIRCECYKKLCIELAREELAENSGSANCSFDNFKLEFYPDEGGDSPSNPRRRIAKTLEACKKYADGFSQSSPNLLFYGKPGLGKTHLSLAIAKAAVDKGYGVIYAPAQKLVSMLEKEHFSSGEGQGSYLKYSCCDLLIIDDLGAEFATRFTSTVLENLINERICNGLPTIISTNYLPDEISKNYPDKMYSRLIGCFKRFQFIGKDIRIMNAL